MLAAAAASQSLEKEPEKDNWSWPLDGQYKRVVVEIGLSQPVNRI